MQAVGVGIPCVAGVHIEHPVVLRAPHSARNKGGIGLGPVQAGLAQAIPVLGVLHHPDDLFAVVLLVVALAENQEVVILAGEEAAEAGELCGHGVRREELEVLVVHLHRDGILGQLLHPGVAPIGAEVEIGAGQYGGVCVVLVVPHVVGLGGHGIGVGGHRALGGAGQHGDGLGVADPADRAGVGAHARRLGGGRRGDPAHIVVVRRGELMDDLPLAADGAVVVVIVGPFAGGLGHMIADLVQAALGALVGVDPALEHPVPHLLGVVGPAHHPLEVPAVGVDVGPAGAGVGGFGGAGIRRFGGVRVPGLGGAAGVPGRRRLAGVVWPRDGHGGAAGQARGQAGPGGGGQALDHPPGHGQDAVIGEEPGIGVHHPGSVLPLHPAFGGGDPLPVLNHQDVLVAVHQVYIAVVSQDPVLQPVLQEHLPGQGQDLGLHRLSPDQIGGGEGSALQVGPHKDRLQAGEFSGEGGVKGGGCVHEDHGPEIGHVLEETQTQVGDPLFYHHNLHIAVPAEGALAEVGGGPLAGDGHHAVVKGPLNPVAVSAGVVLVVDFQTGVAFAGLAVLRLVHAADGAGPAARPGGQGRHGQPQDKDQHQGKGKRLSEPFHRAFFLSEQIWFPAGRARGEDVSYASPRAAEVPPETQKAVLSVNTQHRLKKSERNTIGPISRFRP